MQDYGYRRATAAATTTRCIFKNERVVPCPAVVPSLDTNEPNWVLEVEKFCKRQKEDYKPRIYTDGMFKEDDHDLRTIFNVRSVRVDTGASVIILHDGPDWRDREMLALHIKNGEEMEAKSAFTMEFIALAAALRMQKGFKATATCSDCLSVVKIVHKRHEHLNNSDTSHRVLLQAMNVAISAGVHTPHWVPSHVE